MDAFPKDPAARREALDEWGRAQSREALPPVRFRARVAQRLIGADRLARILTRVASSMSTLDRLADRVLDRGLDTSDPALLPEHTIEGRARYVASAWHVLPRALRYLGVSERDTFIDFGCGKGRVLHQAARWPFHRVIGVEVSPELAEIARGGLAAREHRHRCRNVEVVVSDVSQFRVPDDFTIGYFYRPFGEETLGTVLRHIVGSIDRNPRRVRLIYVSPWTNSAVILATGRFRLLKEQSSTVRRRVDHVAIFESC